MENVVRIKTDLPTQHAGWLAEVVRLTGIDKLTRAIRVLTSLEHAYRKGGEVIIKYPDGSREKLPLR